MKKNIFVLSVLLFAIGFATVTTTLFINGTAKIGVDSSFDGSVIFTSALMDNPSTKTTADTEKGGTASINAADNSKVITLVTGNLSAIGNTSTLNYEVTNTNSNYDASASIVCGTPSDATEKEKSDFAKLVTVTNSKNSFEIAAGESYTGTVTITLKASALGENGTGVDIPVQCVISANAIEKSAPESN